MLKTSHFKSKQSQFQATYSTSVHVCSSAACSKGPHSNTNTVAVGVGFLRVLRFPPTQLIQPIKTIYLIFYVFNDFYYF